VRSNFRLISATCEDLNDKINKGEFRADFFFRIEGFNVTLKPLRERREDFSGLIQHFIKKGERRIVFDSSAKKIFLDYHWPGNVRELERTIEVLQTKERGIVNEADLQSLLSKAKTKNTTDSNETQLINVDEVKRVGLKNYIEKLEVKILESVLNSNQDKVRKTLVDLKLSNNSFYRILDNKKTQEVARA
jgi:transcriptional regulator with PAS, ATPase and Fis domain